MKKIVSHSYTPAVLLALVLSGCSAVRPSIDGPPRVQRDVSTIHNATPKSEPRSRYGNPSTYSVFGQEYHVLKSAKGYNQRGIASWYGRKFHDRLTSSRQPYDPYAMTGASKTLPIPTYVQVTNLANGRQVVVKVNDRGPFVNDRIIDLSYAAAIKLGYANKGTALVQVTAINPTTWGKNLPLPQRTTLVAISHKPTLYLQIGAFLERDNAEKLKKRIQTMTQEPIQVQKGNSHQKALYRVQVGPLPNVTAFDTLEAKLKKQSLGHPFAVVG